MKPEMTSTAFPCSVRKAMNIQRTTELEAVNNVLNEVRQILGAREGEEITRAAQTVMGHASRVGELEARIKELEEFIEEIDHQYEAMQQIKAWCDAYPVDVFTPPDWVEAKEKLGPELLSRVSAANMRHVVDGIRNIITECEKNTSQ